VTLNGLDVNDFRISLIHRNLMDYKSLPNKIVLIIIMMVSVVGFGCQSYGADGQDKSARENTPTVHAEPAGDVSIETTVMIPDPSPTFNPIVLSSTAEVEGDTDTDNPRETPNPLTRFAVIGDYGLSKNPERDVANLVKSWDPDFIITVGDNNYPDGAFETIDENIGQYYQEYIYPYTGEFGDGSEVNRFFPTLGNHDWTTDGGQPYIMISFGATSTFSPLTVTAASLMVWGVLRFRLNGFRKKSWYPPLPGKLFICTIHHFPPQVMVPSPGCSGPLKIGVRTW